MRHRDAISDEDWARIKDLLPGLPGQHGKVARDNRLFVDAVLWVARTDAPWRDLPERFGNWNSTWRRFDRWAHKGAWQRVFEVLKDDDLEWLILDSTIIRAHPCATGVPKNGTLSAARPNRPSAAAGVDWERKSTGLSSASDCPPG